MASFDLTLSPSQIEFVAKPGATITQAYDVINNSENPLLLNTEVLPWHPIGNEGNVSYQNIISSPNILFSLNNSDIKLGQVFTLAPGQKQQLVLKIETSSQASLDDFYYTFFITQQGQTLDSNKSNNTQTIGKIGSHLLLTVSNSEDVSNKAQITKFTVSPKLKDIFLTPITFNAEVKNNSNNFFKTKGTITINKNNVKVKELELSDNNVLTHSSRLISCKDQTDCTFDPPFWPGSYTATLTLDPSLSAPSATISFFVFPFSLTAILIVILTIFFILFRIKKRFFPHS